MKTGTQFTSLYIPKELLNEMADLWRDRYTPLKIMREILNPLGIGHKFLTLNKKNDIESSVTSTDNGFLLTARKKEIRKILWANYYQFPHLDTKIYDH